MEGGNPSGSDPGWLIGEQLTHYRVQSILGQGGMGVVYKAEDTRLGRTVALKVLPLEYSQDAERRQRFQREARAAAALAHPNVCSIFDIGEQDGTPFLVMELIDGQPLAQRMTGQPWPIDELAPIGAQIAEALAAAHTAGIVHRDVKPGNILLTDRGTVKVLDFGLARVAAEAFAANGSEETATALTTHGQLLGTCAYMSPEQAQGSPVTTPTDVFSLGTVLYQMAAGRHPFPGDSAIEVLNAILKQEPVAPSALCPAVSRELDSLILEMLQKEPAARPTAAAAAEALRGLAAPPVPAVSSPVAAPSAHPVVGREKELEALVTAYRGVASGKGQLLCLTGEPGIGKTTLVDSFLSELTAAGDPHTTARGRCSERLVGGEAFLPLLEALEGLLRDGGQPAANQLKLLAPSWFARLVWATPSEGADPRDVAPGLAGSQEQMKRELAAFFQELARLRPMILFIDDIHWAGASTTDLLAHLAARSDAIGLMIVVTYRPSDLRLAEHPFQKIKMELEAKGRATEIPLAFLGSEHLDSYLDLEFPGHAFPRELVELIHSKTGGNPLFMVDLVHYLRDRGALAAVDGRWALAASLPDIEGELPVSVRNLIQLKIERLEATDRELLWAASVQGHNFDSAVLSRALDADAAEVEERLETLDRVHDFVRYRGEEELPDGSLTARYGFVHALYQNSFYASLRPTRRASLSAAVASALRHFHGDRSPEVAYELACLYEGARDFPRATEHFGIASRNNLLVHAYREAAQLARRGLSLVPSLRTESERIEPELELQTTLGPALMAVMGFAAPEVEETYSRVRELSQKVERTPRIFLAICGLWQFHLARGELRQTRLKAVELLQLARSVGDPALLAEAHRALGETLVWAGEVTPARVILEEGLEHFRDAAPSQLTGLPPAVACYAFLGWSLTALGLPEQALRMARESIALAGEHPFRLAFARFFAANIHYFRAEPGAALEHARATIKLSLEHGFPMWLGLGTVMQGWALASEGQGEAEEQVASVRHAIAAVRRTGAELGMSWGLGVLGQVMRAAGHPGDALSVVDEALATVGVIGDGAFLADLHRIKGELLLAVSPERAPAAEECFRQSIEVAREQGARWWELRAALELARMMHLQGRRREAREALVGIHDTFAEGFDTPPLAAARKLLEELA